MSCASTLTERIWKRLEERAMKNVLIINSEETILRSNLK
jgi:hypothetical protein